MTDKNMNDNKNKFRIVRVMEISRESAWVVGYEGIEEINLVSSMAPYTHPASWENPNVWTYQVRGHDGEGKLLEIYIPANLATASWEMG